MKIKKGDTVKIITGKDSGKTGKILSINSKDEKVLVEGLNMFKKHKRPKRQGEKGEIISVARPMRASNVLLVCPRCSQATRVGYKLDGGAKLRICKKCKSTI